MAGPEENPKDEQFDPTEQIAFEVIKALQDYGYWNGTSQDHHDSEKIVYRVLKGMEPKAR